MNMKLMERVIQKVASFQALDESEEMMWQVTQAAHRRAQIKSRALLALSLESDADWPKSWGMDMTLAVAMVLNRHDVLARNGYTIIQAMERINPVWTQSLVEIEAELKAEGQISKRLQQ